MRLGDVAFFLDTFAMTVPDEEAGDVPVVVSRDGDIHEITGFKVERQDNGDLTIWIEVE